MLNSKKKIYHLYIILFCLIFAVFFRGYNINFDNFWFDEILSFWITDNKISLEESFERHREIEQIPYLFHFILKIFFEVFSYDSDLGRYTSLIFNIMGIILATLLCKIVRNNNSYLIALFLFSTNIFLINYSQEFRPYSLIFFLCALNLLIFYKLYNHSKDQDFNFYSITLMTLSNILMIISHPFSLIIFISASFFLILNKLTNQNISTNLIYSFILSFIFSIIYFYMLIDNLNSFPSWIKQPDISFYTNFYFSNFFGSRLMGLIHLIILISLLGITYKKLKSKNFDLNIFIFIIFLSYFLPLMYGFLFRPIIFPRYIIFVLIPIIILLSILIYEIKSKSVRNFIIFIIVLLNIGNHFSESTFQQLYSEKQNYKPYLEKMINILKKNDEKSYTIDMSLNESKKLTAYQAINNYIYNFNIFENSKIEYMTSEQFLNSKKRKIWILCLPDVVFDRCKKINSSSYYKILKREKIPGIKLILVEKLI